MRLAPTETLTVRHRRVREAAGAAGVDALVVTHLPNVFYLTNFQGSAGIAVVMPDRLHLILDFRYAAAAASLLTSPYGPPDTEVVRVEGSYEETLTALLRRLAPRRTGVEAARLSMKQAAELARSLDRELVATEGLIERLRIVKDGHEIEMLRHGARLISTVAVEVIREAVEGVREQELAARIDWRIKSAGFERCSFETIVASGPNAALPHAHAGSRVLQAGDLVVLDFGGVYGGYCVDLTRTVAIGRPDAEMARVYGAVLEAQQAAIAAVRPGARAGDIDAAARQTLAAHGLAEAFGHSTGHGLGIEIHETPRIAPRRDAAGRGTGPADDVIEPGMVFTIEPGAYLPGWGGVRIEDDVLVTSDGVDVLTNVPTSLTETHGI